MAARSRLWRAPTASPTRSTRSAVARAAQREPDLPVARLDGPERELRLLVDSPRIPCGRANPG